MSPSVTVAVGAPSRSSSLLSEVPPQQLPSTSRPPLQLSTPATSSSSLYTFSSSSRTSSHYTDAAAAAPSPSFSLSQDTFSCYPQGHSLELERDSSSQEFSSSSKQTTAVPSHHYPSTTSTQSSHSLSDLSSKPPLRKRRRIFETAKGKTKDGNENTEGGGDASASPSPPQTGLEPPPATLHAKTYDKKDSSYMSEDVPDGYACTFVLLDGTRCTAIYNRRNNTREHYRNKHEGGNPGPFKCPFCSREYVHKCTLDRHIKGKYIPEQYQTWRKTNYKDKDKDTPSPLTG